MDWCTVGALWLDCAKSTLEGAKLGDCTRESPRDCSHFTISLGAYLKPMESEKLRSANITTNVIQFLQQIVINSC